MPRLGEDPNVASAYPHGGGTGNPRGSWLRQLIFTAMGTLIMMMLMKNVFVKDYNSQTKHYLVSHGMEDKVDKVVPKSPAEMRRDALMAKQTEKQKVAYLQQAVVNLTASVQELQLVVGNLTGTRLPMQGTDVALPETNKREGGEDGAQRGEETGGGRSRRLRLAVRRTNLRHKPWREEPTKKSGGKWRQNY